MLNSFEDMVGVSVKQFSSRGRSNAARVPDQKSRAELMFELLDLHPERGLRKVQRGRRSRDISCFDHMAKIVKLVQLDGPLLFRPVERMTLF